MVKKYPNTPKSRKKIPSRPGAYNLKNLKGKTVYTGETKNLRRRVAEHNRDKSKHFSHVTITPTTSKTKAKQVEKKRLKNSKPPENKRK